MGLRSSFSETEFNPEILQGIMQSKLRTDTVAGVGRVSTWTDLREEDRSNKLSKKREETFTVK